jgi:hypothetical protein
MKIVIARIVIALLGAASAFAQIQQPTIGTMLLRDGRAVPLFGIAGSVTRGDESATSVLSMGCSRVGCLLKTDSAIVSSSGLAEAPAGHAIFSFDGDHAQVFFPEVRQLARWQNDTLTLVDFDVAGEILSIRDDAFAVRRESGVWIVNSGDHAMQALPRGTRAVLLLTNGVLFATRDDLFLRRPDAELRFRIEHVESLSWLGENYVQVRTHDTSYALRTDSGHEGVFMLPEPQP